MFFQKSQILTIVGLFICLALLQKVQGIPVTAGDIGPAVYHGAIIGNYAGQLSAGHALSELKFDAVPVKNQEQEREQEEHDFSEGAAKDSPSLYESVGTMGDHLSEQHFPVDYEAEDNEDNGAKEYAEAESQTAASEHHEGHYQVFKQEAQENEVDYGAQYSNHEDFYSKPVPGIDHGKGAYSYSSTYEFPKY